MENETVLVTGASSGIGRELALQFATDAAHLVIVARREEQLEALASEIRENHKCEVTVLVKNLAQINAPDEIHQELSQQSVEVDVLVNNAGFGTHGRFVDEPLQQQLDMIQVNNRALVHLSRLFLPGMIERDRGGVLNVGSTAAFQPGPTMAIYFASKAFVLSFTEALSEELKGTNVTATCMAPGPTLTEFGSDTEIQDSRLFKFGPMKADAVARIGIKGFRRGKPLVVTGLGNRMLSCGAQRVPRSMSRKLAGWLMAK